MTATETIVAAAPNIREDQHEIRVINPVTGDVAGIVPHHTPDDVIAAVHTARAAQPAWAALSFRERMHIFKRFHDAILDRRDELFDVLQSETGKSRRDAFVELFAVASEARYLIANGPRALKSHRIKSAIPLRDKSTVVYHPVGVVGVISPWNFPFILSISDALGALLAGNGVVIKPASLTPLSALWARDLIIECGLPSDLIHVVTGPGRELGEALIDNIDYLMFTGSTETGRKLATRAANRLIPYNMELGGKNALIVLPDSDVKHAATVAIEGTFNNAGQVCINFERAYVHHDIYDRFTQELILQTEALRLGASPDFSADFGSLISQEQLTTVENHVGDALQKGAQILTGGHHRPDLGPYFYEPTILTGVSPDMKMYAEETFGPVLALHSVESVEDAIHQANDSRYGLHFAVMGGDRRRAEQVAHKLEAGSVCVNDSYMIWAAMDGPMGGFKDSGMGRRHGPDGIRRFTEPQTITTNRTRIQISSYETALAINKRLADLLSFALKLWRHIPFIR